MKRMSRISERSRVCNLDHMSPLHVHAEGTAEFSYAIRQLDVHLYAPHTRAQTYRE